MLPQHRLELLEDAMLNRFLKGIDGSLLRNLKLKLNEARRSILVFSKLFDEETCKLAETYYIREQLELNREKTNICENILPETEIQKLERRLVSDVISLVKCFSEYRSSNSEHGRNLYYNIFSPTFRNRF